MLHVTNGTATSIHQTRLGGPVVYWVDILHDGPVPQDLSFDDLTHLRERFLSSFFDLPAAEASLAGRNSALLDFAAHEEVVLWFEHDLYDQLQLIQILDWFANQHLGSTRLSLICSDQYLGPLAPDRLEALFSTRHTVSAAELETARQAWAAFRSPDPAGLLALLRTGTPALPFLQGAIERHLQQFPSTRNGLSRSEQRALESVEAGVSGFHGLFSAHQAVEERIWLGDTTFRRYLQRLTQGQEPLLSEEENRYRLTKFGRLVCQGREDHVRVNGMNRWLGGVHLCDGAPIWRWDAGRRSIAP